ncbi:hypothetical protein LUU34_00281000 [Aix galericulata]|nr:hypothetical protein LUU34_00281000 [Aix galericulata]
MTNPPKPQNHAGRAGDSRCHSGRERLSPRLWPQHPARPALPPPAAFWGGFLPDSVLGALRGGSAGSLLGTNPCLPPTPGPQSPPGASPRAPQEHPPQTPRGSPQSPETPRSSPQSPPGEASRPQRPPEAAPNPRAPQEQPPEPPRGSSRPQSLPGAAPSAQSRTRPCPDHAHPRSDHAHTLIDHAHPVEATPPSRSPLAPRGGSRTAPRLHANEPGAGRALIGYDARRRLRPRRGPGGGGGGGRRGAGAARRARLGSARPRSAMTVTRLDQGQRYRPRMAFLKKGSPCLPCAPATRASRRAAAPRSLFGVCRVLSPSPGPGPVTEPPGALLAPARVGVKGLGASCRGSCQQHKGFSAALGARGSVLPLQPRCVSSRLLVAGAVPCSDRGGKKGFALGVGSAVYLLWGCSAGLALRV